MDNDTHDISDTDAASAAPLGCDECTMGVSSWTATRFGLPHCAHSGRGHRNDRDAADLVLESLAALADVRECSGRVPTPSRMVTGHHRRDRPPARVSPRRPPTHQGATPSGTAVPSGSSSLTRTPMAATTARSSWTVTLTACRSALRRADADRASPTIHPKRTTGPRMLRFRSRRPTPSGARAPISSLRQPSSATNGWVIRRCP